MAVVQPYKVICTGGLDLVSNDFDMLSRPGFARELRNFEVSSQGGYRRINGFTLYGEGSATRPEATNKILGVQPYALGVVVCVDTSVYYSEDGISWLQINKDTGAAGKIEADMAGTAALDRPLQERAQFVMMSAPVGRTSTTYGSLSIATGPNKVARFRIEGTGVSRTFHYEEITTPAAGTYLEVHSRHLCVVDTVNASQTVYYSAFNDDSDFAGSGSGSVTLPDKIVGIKSFRDFLYIFCENSIHRLSNINNPSTISVDQITGNLGCISGYTIQEIGGDLIFLATDGVRTVSGTDRIDDINLGTVSTKIRPIIKTLIDQRNNYIYASTVIKSKDQYRLFYTDADAGYRDQKGIIGTLRPDIQTGQLKYEWSETKGIEVTAMGSSLDATTTEKVYHGDNDGYIYIHDTGDTFNGTVITYNYKTPDFDLGDVGLRKTPYYMELSIQAEGNLTLQMDTKFDFRSRSIMQPNNIEITVPASGSRYGDAIYGTSVYGVGSNLDRVNLIGSGTSVSYKFFNTTEAKPFIINGLYLAFVPHDRR